MEQILRDGLLGGISLLVAGPGGGPMGVAVAGRCLELGASVVDLAVDPAGEEPGVGADTHVLVWDGAGAFAAAADPPAVVAARAALDGAWLAVRATANAAMIPDERGGKIILIAPPPGDPHAEAARAGLENLARVTSIEWARFQIRTVSIHPGVQTGAAEVAELVAYLASPAGDYASGCVFELL